MEKLNVWLTRPLQQVAALEQGLVNKGAAVLHLPMITIEPLRSQGGWKQSIKSKIMSLDQYDLTFFISTNAATLGLECVDDYWPQFPEQVLTFAVGPTTASVIEGYGLKAIYPESVMSSEALLALPELEQVRGNKALIFKGEGGREVLAQGLAAKGVMVDSVALYRRAIPDYEDKYLKLCIEQTPPDVIVVSSAEAMDNMVRLFKPLWQELKEVPLLVSSDRIAELARNLGFEKIFTMPGANDEAIMTALVNFER